MQDKFSVAEISFARRFAKLFFNIHSLLLVYYALVIWVVFYAYSFGKIQLGDMIVCMLVCVSLMFCTRILPLLISCANYIYKIEIIDNKVSIFYKHFYQDKKLCFDKDALKINFQPQLRGPTPALFTFGQKIHGYYKKLFKFF